MLKHIVLHKSIQSDFHCLVQAFTSTGTSNLRWHFLFPLPDVTALCVPREVHCALVLFCLFKASSANVPLCASFFFFSPQAK